MTHLLVVGASGSLGCGILKAWKNEGVNRKLNVTVGLEGNDILMKTHEQCCHAFSGVIMYNADDPNRLNMQGFDMLFIIPRNDDKRIRHVQNYVDAAIRGGIKYILFLSCLGAEYEEVEWTKDFRRMERIIEDSGIPCTFLRISWLLDFQTRTIREDDTICLPIDPNSRIAPLTVYAVANASSAILQNPEPHFNVAYDLAGLFFTNPISLADDASLALDRPIKFVQVSKNQFVQMKEQQHHDREIAQRFAEYFILITSSQKYSELNSHQFFKALTGDHGLHPGHWFKIHRNDLTPKYDLADVRGGVSGGVSGECASCGANPELLETMINLIESMADNYENWFRHRADKSRVEKQNLDRLIQFRRQLNEATSGRHDRHMHEQKVGKGTGKEQGYEAESGPGKICEVCVVELWVEDQ